MKKLVIVSMVFFALSSIQLAKASIIPKLKPEDVLSIQVNRIDGDSRLFKESDGYEEVIINKVVKWINTSNPSEIPTELAVNADGVVLYAQDNTKVRLKSLELFDWLLVGWKYESVGAPKDELLEETLYTRYFSYLDKTYSDFIMCPKINKIERINGDTGRHIVHASALNYGAHHGNVPYDRIHITLTDTPENGVVINKVTIQKGISGKESRVQCRREN